MEKFIDGYIECALWASTLGDDCGTPMDQDHSIEDFPAETLEVMRADCVDFFEANQDAIEKFCDAIGQDESYAGHDFWLTRNGHGAGFWDRGAGALGDTLSDAAHQAGTCDLYIGDDLQIHIY